MSDRRRAFTLIELMVVMAIVAIAAALSLQLSTADRREANVRAAAEELAATMRAVRSKAMDERAVFGLAFNIRNGVGTSGRVLNNWDGGHWYRIIGPSEFNNDPDLVAAPSFPVARFSSYTNWNPNTWPGGLLDLVRASWIGDRHVLAARKVRFLALTDQDNGGQVDPDNFSDVFVSTYPRPWFGQCDPATGTTRLYPWGGYDHAIVDRYGRACSGFYFEGNDGNSGQGIVGSVNPTNRTSTWDTAGTRLLTAGSGRSLINADWLDFTIRFFPDGKVEQGPLLPTRYESWRQRSNTNQAASGAKTGGNLPFGDLGDFCGRGKADGTANRSSQTWYDQVMTSYVRHTGNLTITLAPDAEADTDSFPSVKAAWRTLMPAYRVAVNSYGLVRVIKVKPSIPVNTTWASPIAWQTLAQLRSSYGYLWRTDASRQPYGRPATDFLSEEMLISRNWWMAP